MRCSPNGRTISTRSTTIFEPRDIVHVPYPHVERGLVVRRPALVVARRDTEAVGVLLWTLMITNAARPPWAGDIVISGALALGLRAASKVRTAKITTVEEGTAARIGRLDEQTWSAVLAEVALIGRPHVQ